MKTPLGEYVLVQRSVEWIAIGTEDEVSRWAAANVDEIRANAPVEDLISGPEVRIEPVTLTDRVLNPNWPATHRAVLTFSLTTPGSIPEEYDASIAKSSLLGNRPAGPDRAENVGDPPRLTIVSRGMPGL